MGAMDMICRGSRRTLKNWTALAVLTVVFWCFENSSAEISLFSFTENGEKPQDAAEILRMLPIQPDDFEEKEYDDIPSTDDSEKDPASGTV